MCVSFCVWLVCQALFCDRCDVCGGPGLVNTKRECFENREPQEGTSAHSLAKRQRRKIDDLEWGRSSDRNNTRHDYIGHNYIGHNYIGHNYIGHNYIGHDYIGRNYIGRNYIGRNYIGRREQQAAIQPGTRRHQPVGGFGRCIMPRTGTAATCTARIECADIVHGELVVEFGRLRWPTCVVMAYVVMAYVVMAYVVMAHIGMAHTVMAYVVMAYVVMAYVVMAYIAEAELGRFRWPTCVVMAYIVMPYTVMAYIGMAYIYSYGLYSQGRAR